MGIIKNKIIIRHKIAQKTPEWYEKRKEIIAKRIIYRAQIVLDDIPFRGSNYFGFRIIAFSHNHNLLVKLKTKMKERLIEFIENCLKYRHDEFWFNMYWGYEGFDYKKVSTATISDNNKFYLQWQKRYGGIRKEEKHSLMELV